MGLLDRFKRKNSNTKKERRNMLVRLYDNAKRKGEKGAKKAGNLRRERTREEAGTEQVIRLRKENNKARRNHNNLTVNPKKVRREVRRAIKTGGTISV